VAPVLPGVGKYHVERVNMDELIKLVSQKTGIPEATAKTAVETVVGYLKDKLPEPLAGQVENLLEGGDLGDVGDLAKGLGGLFGK
jgi:hypothetical protein